MPLYERFNHLERVAEAAEKALYVLESQQIDWALFNVESPDYDPSYQPKFNAETIQLQKALKALKGAPCED